MRSTALAILATSCLLMAGCSSSSPAPHTTTTTPSATTSVTPLLHRQLSTYAGAAVLAFPTTYDNTLTSIHVNADDGPKASGTSFVDIRHNTRFFGGMFSTTHNASLTWCASKNASDCNKYLWEWTGQPLIFDGVVHGIHIRAFTQGTVAHAPTRASDWSTTVDPSW